VGVLATIDGIPWMDVLPFENALTNVKLCLIRESIKGVQPFFLPLIEPIYSLEKLSKVIIMTFNFLNSPISAL
jgi:hypothetical protein